MDNYPSHSQHLFQDGNQAFVDQSSSLIWPTHVPLSYPSPDGHGPITVFIPVIPPNEKSEGQDVPWFTIPGTEEKFPSEFIQEACGSTVTNTPLILPPETGTWNLNEPSGSDSVVPTATMMHEPFESPSHFQPPRPQPVFELIHVAQHAERRLTNISLPAPSVEEEVFIGNIPREITVDDIYSVFARIGTVYQARIKTNFSGQSKGYGFVKFYNEGEAARAIMELKGYKFDPSVQKGIHVHRSINNNRLFIHNIPKNLDAKGIYELGVHHPMILGLVNVECPINTDQPCNCNRNRGYCFMEFETHLNAMSSLKAMLKDPKMLFSGYSINAQWANPKCT